MIYHVCEGILKESCFFTSQLLSLDEHNIKPVIENNLNGQRSVLGAQYSVLHVTSYDSQHIVQVISYRNID